MKEKVFLVLMVLTALLATACGGNAPGGAGVPASGSALQEVQSVEAEQPAAVETSTVEGTEVEGDEEPGSETEPGEGSVPLTGEVIEHQQFPVAFSMAPLQRVIDCNTGRRAVGGEEQIVAPDCDKWGLNRYERPYDASGETYLPGVDIVTAELGEDEEWIYARISMFMHGDMVPVLDGSYALEIDLDLDGRGDFLVLVDNPTAAGTADWSVSGVQVWQDANNDVGSRTAAVPDGDTGDGFETILFDAGLGEDSDLAWARVSPDEPNIVELSFKKSLLAGQKVFAWWVWASSVPSDPSAFDYNDSHGESVLAGLDSTCAWMFGQAPIDLPNICPVISVPSQAGQGGGNPDTCTPPPEGCPGYEYWIEELCACVYFN